MAAKHRFQCAVRRERLNAETQRVVYMQISLPVHGDVRREVELSRPCAPLADDAYLLAVGIEYPYAMSRAVGDIKATRLEIPGQPGRTLQEFSVNDRLELAVRRIYEYPGEIGVREEYAAVRGYGYGHR